MNVILDLTRPLYDTLLQPVVEPLNAMAHHDPSMILFAPCALFLLIFLRGVTRR